MDRLCFWIRGQHRKAVSSPQIDNTFKRIPISPQNSFFIYRQDYSKMYVERQIAKPFFLKKNKVGGNSLPNFKICDAAAIIRTVWSRQKVDAWVNATESRTHRYCFLTKVQNSFKGGKVAFPQMILEQWYISKEAKTKQQQQTLNLSLKLNTKINSTWITDLDVKCKNTKHRRESLGYWQSILRFNTKSMIDKRKEKLRSWT